MIAEFAAPTYAVIDDHEPAAEVVSLELEEAGFRTVIFSRHYDSLSELIGEVKASSSAAVCDHRLGQYGLGDFDGAEVVANLYRQQFPAVLITQYTDDDAALSIRPWRSEVPVLLKRQESDAISIADGVAAVSRELAGEMSAERRPWRTLVRIEDVGDSAGTPTVRSVIPGWNPEEFVTFPLSIIPAQMRDRVTPGAYLFGRVNVGAATADDLYFSDFELSQGDEDLEL